MGNYITQISEINTDNIFNNCINSLISCDNNNKLETQLPNTIQTDVCTTLPNTIQTDVCTTLPNIVVPYDRQLSTNYPIPHTSICGGVNLPQIKPYTPNDYIPLSPQTMLYYQNDYVPILPEGVATVKLTEKELAGMHVMMNNTSN